MAEPISFAAARLRRGSNKAGKVDRNGHGGEENINRTKWKAYFFFSLRAR